MLVRVGNSYFTASEEIATRCVNSAKLRDVGTLESHFSLKIVGSPKEDIQIVIQEDATRADSHQTKLHSMTIALGVGAVGFVCSLPMSVPVGIGLGTSAGMGTTGTWLMGIGFSLGVPTMIGGFAGLLGYLLSEWG